MAAVCCESLPPQHSKRNWLIQKRKTSGPITAVADIVTAAENENLNGLLAREIYASGTPLTIVSNKYWLAFFKALRPAYEPPSLYQVSHPLLNEEHERVTKLCKDKILSSDVLTLSCDGWTNIRGEGLVNVIVLTPDPFLYKAIHPKENRETAQFVSSEIIEVLEEVGSGKFMAVVTDHAANMKAAWKIISTKFPNITCYGCAPHGLNLLIGDTTKVESLKKVIKNLQTIVKNVKRSHVTLAVFSKKQKEVIHGSKCKSLELPSKTRFSGVLILSDSAYSNKNALQATVIDEAVKIDKDIKNIILDNEEFWPQVQSLTNLLKPIADIIALLESEHSSVADVLQVLAYMNKRIADVLDEWPYSTVSDVQYIEKVVYNRFAFICKPIHLSANLLHPEYRGFVLTSSQTDQAIDFISSQSVYFNIGNAQVLANLAEYRRKTSVWSKKVLENGNKRSLWPASELTTASVWWKGLCPSEPLMPFASRILQLKASAASNERVWSAYEGTHTKKRNRLTSDKADKLVKIRWNLNFLNTDVLSPKKPKQEKWKGVSDFCKGYTDVKLPEENTDISESESDADSLDPYNSDSENLYDSSDSE